MRENHRKQQARDVEGVSFGAANVAITPLSFRTFEARQRCIRIFLRVEGFHHRLTVRSDPAPVADDGGATKQGRLDREHIEAPHILCSVDTVKMNQACFLVLHARILASL